MAYSSLMNHENLEPKEVNELLLQIKSNGCEYAKEDLILGHMKLIKSIGKEARTWDS